VLVCGGSFAAVQFAMANYVGAALVDVVAGIVSLVSLAGFLRWWQPQECWQHGDVKRGQAPAALKTEPVAFPKLSQQEGEKRGQAPAALTPDAAAFPKRLQQEPVPFSNDSARTIAWAWMPWVFLSVAVLCWGLPAVKATLEGRIVSPRLPKTIVAPELSVPRLDGRIAKVPPATREPFEIERAVYRFNWLSAAGTAILMAAVIAVPWLGLSWRRAVAIWWDNLRRLSLSLLTIALMLALAFVTRYSGTDVTLGLALTRSGWFYPFFAPLLGWLGVALTGSDTSSNAMFGSLQRVTAEQLGLDPLLICTANSTGGVMGKMIDAQSIVVSATATGMHRQEGAILRRVFPHSLALAALMGLLVWLQSGPLAWMVPR
jgi:lactate permease